MTLVGASLRCCVLAFFFATAAPAAAEPSVWARAADPKVAAAADVLAELRPLYETYAELAAKEDTKTRAPIYLQRARVVLDSAGAELSPDPAVRYALARVEGALHARDRDPAHIRRALAELEWIVAQRGAPGSQAASTELVASSLAELALCHAHLGQRDEEIAGYSRALALEADPLQRSVLLANQAEGLMNAGALAGAIRGYREAIALLPNVFVPHNGATTLWGLAVALDRSGDHPAALEQVALARSYDPHDDGLKSDGWFFMPPYDKHWYEALGHEARAEAAEPAARPAELEQAIDSWHAYLAEAAADDRWLALAEQRLRRVEKARSAPRR